MHDAGCEGAEGKRCRCKLCYGTQHAASFLKAAVRAPGRPYSKKHFSSTLTAAYGSPFTNLTSKPSSIETPGRRLGQRGWLPIDPTKTEQVGAIASQLEQRIVDTGVRDILDGISRLPASRKRSWESVRVALTTGSWEGVATAIDRLPPSLRSPDGLRGYFWAAVMAAAAKILDADLSRPADPTLRHCVAAELASGSYSKIAYPRRRTPKHILELTDSAVCDAVGTAVQSGIAEADRLNVSRADQMLLIQAIGAVACVDPWHHPAVVRWCVRPALEALDGIGMPSSLVTPGKTTRLIEDYLERHWRRWGCLR